MTLDLEIPDGWRPVEDEDARRWRHDGGLELVVRWRDRERARLEVDVIAHDAVAQAPAPRARLTSPHPLVPWLAGASGQVVALTASGPVLATQHRGFATGTAEDIGLFPEPLVVAPGHPASSVWVFEQLPGDGLDVPAEPAWLPARRHVPHGEEIDLTLPDGVVTGVDAVERDHGFLLIDEPGLHLARIGGPTGVTELEVGWFMDWSELVRAAAADAPDDLWAYLSTLHSQEVDVDELDVRLARALEAPTVWAACAAINAVGLGLPLDGEARAAAEAVLPSADTAGRIALITHGLAPVSTLMGVRLGREAVDGLARFGMGRVTSEYPDGAERSLAAAWFWLAGMGDSEAAARVGGIVGLVQARALCRASETLDAEAVAWLSLFA